MSIAVEAPTTAADRMATSYPDPTARVNLLPPEIVADRNVRAVKRRVVVALVMVALVVVAADLWFRLDDSRATTAVEGAQATVSDLRAVQATFVELPMIAAQQATIDRTLAALMVNDTPWDTDLAALRTSGIGEIRFVGVNGSVQAVGVDPVTDSLTAGSLDRSGVEQIGVLTVTGRAPDQQAVATWVASLTEVDGFLVPYILGTRYVADNGGEVEFMVEITMGQVLRSQRYAEPVAGVAPATDATTTDEGGS